MLISSRDNADAVISAANVKGSGLVEFGPFVRCSLFINRQTTQGFTLLAIVARCWYGLCTRDVASHPSVEVPPKPLLPQQCG